jgi:hypothetical protein
MLEFAASLLHLGEALAAPKLMRLRILDVFNLND